MNTTADTTTHPPQSVTRSPILRLIEYSLIALAILCCIYKLGQIPEGFYVDEVSSGVNGALIEQTLHDEHGDFLPVFFKAFGEYQNPIHIYSIAILFKLFGISEFTLRLQSVIFFALVIIGCYKIVQLLFKNTLVNSFTIVAIGWMPWY